MTLFYLDIETTGTNPRIHKIISIQYQQLSKEGKTEGDLTILKEWDPESSEKRIVAKFFDVFTSSGLVWGFIPVGKNVLFDLTFLQAKFKDHLGVGLDWNFLYQKPVIDVKHALVLMNKCEFLGYGKLMKGVEGDGERVPGWYSNQEWDKIEAYIKEEANNFLSQFQSLVSKLSAIRL